MTLCPAYFRMHTIIAKAIKVAIIPDIWAKTLLLINIEFKSLIDIKLEIFNDKASDNIVFCSSEKFENSETPFCKYIAVNEKNNQIDLNDMLDKLANQGITSLLVEGGPKVIETFNHYDLIDEVYLYTSKDNLDNATLKNPLNIDSDNWIQTEVKYFENDKLTVVRKKELCFQE